MHKNMTTTNVKEKQELTTEQADLIKGAGVTLGRIRRLFKDNHVGKEDGGKMIQHFLRFTFNGNALYGTESAHPVCANYKAIHIQRWVRDIKGLLVFIKEDNAVVLNDLFSDNADESLHYGMVQSAFVDTVLGVKSPLDGKVDGTVGVLACASYLHDTDEWFDKVISTSIQ